MSTFEQAGRSTCRARAITLERRLEQHRTELTALCCRMLGPLEAEDAVQETLMRAWLGFERFEGRAALGTWLHRIAFNVCLDILGARQRRARHIEFLASTLAREPAASARGSAPAAADHEGPASPTLNNPAEAAVVREAVQLAFVTLARLPARQRAALILRDVLRWKADEVAQLLDTTVASVNGALQRARSTLATRRPNWIEQHAPEDVTQQELLVRCVDAFERYDLELLVSVLRDDVRHTALCLPRGGSQCRVNGPGKPGSSRLAS